MDARKAVGKKIELARRELSWNQHALATAFNTNQATVSRMEKGQIKIDFFELARLAEVLHKPLEYFLEPLAVSDNRIAAEAISRYSTGGGGSSSKSPPELKKAQGGKSKAA